MGRQTYPYDVFISYSHKNQKWVAEKLIPRLSQAQIAFAWDVKDFAPGKSFNAEMLRLMRESKHTVILLSKEWLGSNFTDFEFQMSRAMDPKTREARVLVLNLDSCEPPRQQASLTSINAAVLGEDAAIRKLVDYLLESKSGKPPMSSIWGDFKLWKELSSNPGGGYQYCGQLNIGNPIGSTIEFDSILIRAHVPSHADARPHSATAIKIMFTDRGMSIGFCYEPTPEFHTPQDSQPEIVTLESGKGIGLPSFDFGPLRGSVAASEPVACSLALYRGANQVSGENWCVLPPVARLTSTSFHGPGRFDAGPGFELQLLPEKFMSPKSGIMDQDLLDAIFESAGRTAQDSLLLRVRPETLTVHTMHGGDELHTAAGWKFVFFSESKGATFDIAPEDPNWVDPATFVKETQLPACWLSENLLYRCWLDASYAYLLSLSVCQPAGKDNRAGFALDTVIIDGIWTPVWHLPREYQGQPAGVTADTGEIVVFEESEARKPNGVIWNS